MRLTAQLRKILILYTSKGMSTNIINPAQQEYKIKLCKALGKDPLQQTSAQQWNKYNTVMYLTVLPVQIAQ